MPNPKQKNIMTAAGTKMKWRTVSTTTLSSTDVIKRGEVYRVLPDGRWEFFFDNHKIRTFSDCEAKYQLKHVLRIGLKSGAFGAAATIGIWWSRTLELFYNQVRDWQEGRANQPGRTEILVCAGTAWVDCNMETWKATDPNGYDTFKGIPGSMQMAGRYYDGAACHDMYNWRIVAAEMGFGLRREVYVGETERVKVYYIGKPDLVVISKQDNRLMPVDHKSLHRITGHYHAKYKPHSQTAGYIYATNAIARELGMNMEVDRCIINLAARMEPADKPRGGGPPKPRFARAFPHYSPQEIEEWRTGIIHKAEALRICYETNYWPWREQACHLYNGCEYRRIHAVPPGSRAAAIAADFVQIEPWAPYEVEEEEENGYF